jgi:hypothetical protein
MVLSLCDRTGIMIQPWLEAGYECVVVDISHKPGMHAAGINPKLWMIGIDIRDFDPQTHLNTNSPAIIFAFPPCTHLANSGNRYKRDKGLEALYEALGLVIACKRICESANAPWMIENPVGALSTYWREPDATFQPWEYTTPKENKRTCLWVGHNFVLPQREVFTKPADVQQSVWKMAPSADRGNRRSVTPEGFARAVFHANQPWIERTK